MINISEDNEQIIYNCIKDIFKTKKIILLQDIMERTNIHYNTILKYVSILEAKNKINVEIIGTAKVIVGVNEDNEDVGVNDENDEKGG